MVQLHLRQPPIDVSQLSPKCAQEGEVSGHCPENVAASCASRFPVSFRSKLPVDFIKASFTAPPHSHLLATPRAIPVDLFRLPLLHPISSVGMAVSVTNMRETQTSMSRSSSCPSVHLDLKGATLLAEMQARPVPVSVVATKPAVDELKTKLESLKIEPQTPRPKESLVSATSLGPDSTVASDGLRSGHDSGYSSAAHTPDNPEAVLVEQPGFSRTGFQSSKLRIFNKPVPDHLQNRFHDFRRLYSADLITAVFKKNVDGRDMSMRLKYLGKNESSARLYIVVQCGQEFAKRVRKFFEQKNVLEDPGDDFKVHIVKRELQQLASSETIDVFGARITDSLTMCGRAIMMDNHVDPVFATIGGLIRISAPEETICAVTAGHPIRRLYQDESPDTPPGLGVNYDTADSSDEGEPLEDDDMIQFDDIEDETSTVSADEGEDTRRRSRHTRCRSAEAAGIEHHRKYSWPFRSSAQAQRESGLGAHRAQDSRLASQLSAATDTPSAAAGIILLAASTEELVKPVQRCHHDEPWDAKGNPGGE